ncbi:MAG: Gfo/Idh/MocA family oxidoreductase [Chitinophagaceae bacterium]|nr:Gfo/Idh/MocA family oxidoreductase [Chitinophagaceae bacterium]
MKRRDFVKQSSWLTGGLLLHRQMWESFSTKQDSRPIRIGVIGCGDRGRGLIDTATELSEKFEVVAVCDNLAFRLDALRKDFSGKNWSYYPNYLELLNKKEVEAVWIAAPLHLHYEMAVASLKAGKHVYLEKTMTYNRKQAGKLVRLCKEYPKQIFQVGHQYRYTPLYFRIRDMIEGGALGKVTQIHCRWDRNWDWRRPVPDGYTDRQINWRMYKEYSGGLAAELLSHQIDFINWAYDTHPDEIYATGGIDFYPDGRETFDNLQAVLRYNKAGMIGNFGATCANEREGYIFKLKGSRGTIELLMNEGYYYPEKQTRKELETVDGVSGATKIEWNKEGGMPLVKEKMKDGTWYALVEFHKVVTEGGLPTSNVQTGATSAICVDMINQSSYNKRIERWENIV